MVGIVRAGSQGAYDLLLRETHFHYPLDVGLRGPLVRGYARSAEGRVIVQRYGCRCDGSCRRSRRWGRWTDAGAVASSTAVRRATSHAFELRMTYINFHA